MTDTADVVQTRTPADSVPINLSTADVLQTRTPADSVPINPSKAKKHPTGHKRSHQSIIDPPAYATGEKLPVSPHVFLHALRERLSSVWDAAQVYLGPASNRSSISAGWLSRGVMSVAWGTWLCHIIHLLLGGSWVMC